MASARLRSTPMQNTVESRLYMQIGTQKFGCRTERDVQVKIISRIRPCKVFWKLYELNVQTSGTYNWETYNWDSTVLQRGSTKESTPMFLVFLQAKLNICTHARRFRIVKKKNKLITWIWIIQWTTKAEEIDDPLAGISNAHQWLSYSAWFRSELRINKWKTNVSQVTIGRTSCTPSGSQLQLVWLVGVNRSRSRGSS